MGWMVGIKEKKFPHYRYFCKKPFYVSGVFSQDLKNIFIIPYMSKVWAIELELNQN